MWLFFIKVSQWKYKKKIRISTDKRQLDNCDICWLTGGGTDQNIAWPVSWHGQVFTISDGVNIITIITIVKDIKVWINAAFNKSLFIWWGWLISAGYDHVPWLDRSHLRFHKRSRVHHNSIEEWSPIVIQHFHFTGWRQCTKASQASYSVSVERILRWRSFHLFPVLAFIVFGYAVLYGVRMELQKLAKEYEESQLINKTLIN